MASTYIMCRVIYHPKYSLYNLGDSHPFSPLRVQMVIELLKDLNIYQEPSLPNLIEPSWIKKIHDSNYVDIVEKLSTGENIENHEDFGLGTSDNPIVMGMAEGARYQTAGTLFGAQLLTKGEARKVLQLGGGFHHAHYKYASGFCLYNDLAAAIQQMTEFGWHVVYLDIDVHHGDGVQELFYDNGNVMTISVHESGEYLFPGRGWVHELGKGIGRSLKLNIPLEPFSEGNSYFEVIEKVGA